MILLSGCGTQGVTNLALLNEPIPSKQSRLIITRNMDMLYMAAAADVEVNGKEIASLGRGGSVVYDVAADETLITLRTMGSSAKFSASFNLEVNKTYNFEVSPRSEGFWSRPAYSAAFGLLGETVYAETHENSGFFQINLKDIK